ncbi:acyl-CoA ligase (AMP-forming), exosortase A system-associated [Emcibacter nanhaiensis]|uniref:Acyl-CoA ligase (AMP-forming), exosortase A system-associated n=1 Tax=Emcibacter nanhaiensis TaxID=1505037 RepID=A0A501PAF8_9PROT|nr:acyl-CoA ligase (AMP-forming), exosortase A system-associated [Emcibacter nanhaiensis]TPD57333.1 acyl-CoA ligase (AMP-forming), exosortase A system-associated [Emcibacter nanhaiensis]
MINKLSDFVRKQSISRPDHTAIVFKAEEVSYGEFARLNGVFGAALMAAGMAKNDRVAVFLPKQIETVVTVFGASEAGGVFVPVNPTLKARQVAYILNDCNVRYLVTSADRLAGLAEELQDCSDLKQVILVGKIPDSLPELDVGIGSWEDFMATGEGRECVGHPVIDADMAAILYTSGSTGMPKGVIVSHRNLIVGAESVSTYLKNTPEDKILSVLPLSFDAGFSQLTTAFRVGATVVLMNYLLPRDVIRQAAKHSVTGITCVPPLWIQLVDMDWPPETVDNIRYIATTGGRMPVHVTKSFRQKLPKTDIYLMYGLTEAFRSTYLPPEEVDRIPDSMGKAIPNAEIMVVREDGTPCDPGEPGELVHRGALVALGYWNDPERTAERFKPAPGQPEGIPMPEIAVWSGDTVKKDEDGFLYFVGRRDEMIKTSGYRTSPTELEETIYASGLIGEIAAIGVEHEQLGQAIWIVATGKEGAKLDEDAVLAYCRAELPSYMVPHKIIEWTSLPRNPNGKIDRKAIAAEVTK